MPCLVLYCKIYLSNWTIGSIVCVYVHVEQLTWDDEWVCSRCSCECLNIFKYQFVIITIVGSVYNITKNDAEWTSTAFIIYNGDIHEFDFLAINHNSHFRIFLPVLSNECIWVSRFYCCLPIYKILLISTLDHHRLRTRRQCTDRSLVRCLCYYISVVYIGCLSTSLYVFIGYSLLTCLRVV